MKFLGGTINPQGQTTSGGGFTVLRQAPGEYSLGFTFKAGTVPALVGSQTSSGNPSEANTDGIVFPSLGPTNALARTGDNNGVPEYRSFSIIGVGETGLAPELPQSLILWGTINADGSIASSSGGFTVARTQKGHLEITFEPSFEEPPAIVGTQTGSGNLAEANTDGVVFPVLNNGTATAITGG